MITAKTKIPTPPTTPPTMAPIGVNLDWVFPRLSAIAVCVAELELVERLVGVDVPPVVLPMDPVVVDVVVRSGIVVVVDVLPVVPMDTVVVDVVVDVLPVVPMDPVVVDVVVRSGVVACEENEGV
jgi:hypothetical protein